MAGPARKQGRKEPQRSCLSCRAQRDKRALTRLVRGADRSVQIDERGRAPGRGAYLCESPDCWGLALDGGALERALRTAVSDEDRATLRDYARRLATGEASAAAPVGGARNGEGVR